jgi:hypothetical protein
VDRDVVLGDRRLRREGDHLLAQVDERLEPVDEGHDDRQPGLGGPAVAPEALDDPGSRLGNDADRSRGNEDEEDRHDGEDDETGHSVSLP